MTITGRITDRRGAPVSGLVVRAYLHGPAGPGDLHGEAVTTTDGRYVLTTVAGQPDERSEMLIRVFAGARQVGERRVPPDARGAADVAVDHAIENPAEQPRLVVGTVRDSFGRPLPQVTVRAVDVDLRTEQPLGDALTDHEGAYRIEYFPRQFRRAEKTGADLVASALDARGRVLATSAVQFNAASLATIDLMIPASSRLGSTLFETLAEALPPILDGVHLAELDEGERHRDITFLAGETGFAKTVLGRFVIAHRLSTNELPPEFWFAVLGPSVYVFDEQHALQDQVPLTLDGAAALDERAVRKALASSLAAQEIPASLEPDTDRWIEAFRSFVAARAVEQSAPIRDALDAVGIRDQAAREQVARVLVEHRALTAEAVAALRDRQIVNDTQLDDLRVWYSVADLTQGDATVVRAIQKELDLHKPEQLPLLARRSARQWVDFISRGHKAGEIRLPVQTETLGKMEGPPEAEIYGRLLERRFREAYPTAAFAGGLDRASRDGGGGGVQQARELREFLDRYSEFDLLRTSAEKFLSGDVAPEYTRDPFRQALKAVQRVYKLTDTYEGTATLLADDVHSAQQIYRMGRSEFVRRYKDASGFTLESAQHSWSKAADTHATVLTVVGELKALDPEGLPPVLQSGGDPSTFPNWSNLFSTGDLCECDHCRSVLGPAAYFADLLMFLRDRRAANPARSVRDILFDRRSDLGYLELHCENALTTMPYIDVVCEVLEQAMAGDAADLELTGFTAVPPGEAAAHAAVDVALSAGSLAVGTFTLAQVTPSDPDRWVVHGEALTLLLKKKTTANFFAQVLPNTKRSAEELRAYPQYVNAAAYATLGTVNYPMTLPFDLFGEEVRTAFQKAGVKRWELMQVMHGIATPGDVAREYFGISTDPIVPANATVVGQQEYWGENAAGWLTDVGRVDRFLNKTRLEYQQLLALLDLPFINPAGDIAVHHDNASCDLNTKVIQVLDEIKLDRIHRFLRLWRKLTGWKMWELDLAIRRLGGGSLDEPFLIQLQAFEQLRSRLGPKVPVEHLLALFGDLNVETRFTKPDEKREDGHYQQLFLNGRLINPLDPAFVDLPAGEIISGHQATVLAALRIREADLLALQGLTRVSTGLPYIDDQLTLSNLSFLWRHSWLPKQLKLKPAEWTSLLWLVQEDVAAFSTPRAALTFVEKVDHLRASGLSIDQLTWLLAANRDAAAAVKEADAARFLTTLRQQIQAIRAVHDVAPPTDVEGLSPLLMSLLQTLGRDEAAARSFVQTLAGPVVLESAVNDLAPFAFPLSVTAAPNHIPIEFDAAAGVLRFRGQLTDAQRVTLAALSPNPSYAVAIQDLFDQSQTAGERFATAAVVAAAPGVTLPTSMPSLPIHFNTADNQITFVGLMSDAERLALIAAGNPAATIEELFRQPRLAARFYRVEFATPLDLLPVSIDFRAQLTPDLARRVSYDAERAELHVDGILSDADRTALLALVPAVLLEEIAYHAAVTTLANLPLTIPGGDERVWLTDTDLDFTLPASDTLVERLTTAVVKALAFLSKTLSTDAVLQQAAAQLGLTEAVTERLLTDYAVAPGAFLPHLIGPFAATSGPVSYASMPATMDAWFWATRAALLLRKWKVSRRDLVALQALGAPAQLLDLLALPLTSAAPPAPADRFIRTARLMRLREVLPESGITLLEVLEKLRGGAYPQSDFAEDLHRLNEDWGAADGDALVTVLDLVYAGDYLLAEHWERLRRAFSLLEKLNASPAQASAYAIPLMGLSHATAIKEGLRARFGTETWLTVSTEIQDVLRVRKRDALAAYLLTQPQPVDAPSGRWENTNDLYAYYLLDVEMDACMLTSRLVQGSGSVQLFVQRCFMGLEPKVVVKDSGDDGDSAWRWWKWLRKYRVSEANRKVFLWPENWIEPELKKDRSPFFKDLENELQQNEINQFTVEAAFTHYLEKLHGVSQLEIAGFYQEDDADNTIVHVFGRTPGGEPRTYYYRRYDYRQWTPWEKVDLDIQGDYLIPAVINRRLYLFWPVFTEVPDEAENNRAKTVTIKIDSPTSFGSEKPYKKLKLQMAASDYQQGRWTPRRVSTDSHLSHYYNVETLKRHYQFHAIDGGGIDGRFAIEYEGSSLDALGNPHATLGGVFEVAGCNGMPVRSHRAYGYFNPAVRAEVASTGVRTDNLKWQELEARTDSAQDFTLATYAPGVGGAVFHQFLLAQTPWLFRMTPPWHATYLDKLWIDGKKAFPNIVAISRMDSPLGGWAPYFYDDKRRTFFVLPATGGRSGRRESFSFPRLYYPDIKRGVRQIEGALEGAFQTWLEGVDLIALPPAARQSIDTGLYQAFPEEAAAPFPVTPPPYTADEAVAVKILLVRWFMRFWRWYLASFTNALLPFQRHHFKNHYHPFVCEFARLVYNPMKGIPALMSRKTQLMDSGFSFLRTYQPSPLVLEQGTEQLYPRENVDFTPDGSYSPYNWELFYHVPLFIANMLSRNQRFEEAREWYHFIFNPIGVAGPMPGGSPMSKYWITKPFFDTTTAQYVQQRIETLLLLLADDTTAPGYSPDVKKELENQVRDWRTYPFEPHRIANYRTVAYQKTVVMKYLDNLIAWGDYLFRQDSMESINEATQLYIMAAEILGPRPRTVPPHVTPPVATFNELEDNFDALSNALIQVENIVPPPSGDPADDADPAPLPMLYFCIPHNEKLLGYWDTVADRLYKLRNCMNIDGVVRHLALFEPPIDPAALVKAVAGGLDIGAALADLNAPLPLYRFRVLLQKANEVCADVKALAGALLPALEKKDAEALALLRQGHEIQVLTAVQAVREQQIDEAKETLTGLKRAQATAETRRDYYRDIERIASQEQLQMDKLAESHTLQEAAQGLKNTASAISVMPAIDIGGSGFGGSPVAKFKIGGLELGQAASLAADALSFFSMIAANDSTMAGIKAGFDRRWNDWKLQERLAVKELDQIASQIAAAELRIAIAERELDNQKLQIENAKETDAFMRSKYTNLELYQWQIGQISGVYFQSYRLAFDLAKRAERCFRFELGLQDSSFISFGYWDSLKKGLMSGERLQFDLRRLETAYLEQNRREFELTKQVSIALVDPLALIKLRETGRCIIRLPEELFDRDLPGHYRRRLKSVSFSILSVVGSHTTMSCTLRLLKNSIRISTAIDGDYPRNTDDAGLPAEDTRFIESNVPTKATVTSTAVNDPGLFEVSFQDDRYLPFEGAGVISEWAIELFHDLPSNNPDPAEPDFGRPLRQFDYSTISDAILHLRFTSREDAGPFKNAVVTHLRGYFAEPETTRSMRVIDVRQEFPDEWHRFLYPTNPAAGNVMELELSSRVFPSAGDGKQLNINSIAVLARATGADVYKAEWTFPVPPAAPGDNLMNLVAIDQYGGLRYNRRDVAAWGMAIVPFEAAQTWQLRIKRDDGGDLQEDPVKKVVEVEDVWVALGYSWD
jgi:hypothetical protein